MLHGVDVATYQGNINWDALKASKDFAIIKATGGCPDKGQLDTEYLDPHFVQNRDAARARGMLRGFYHYAYPEYNTPEEEAAYVARVMSDAQPGEFVALDYESTWGGNVVDWCKRWLDTFSDNAGFKPLLYINLAMAKAHNWQPVIDAGYGLWLAQWTYSDQGNYDQSQPWPFAAFQQYANNGIVGGIPAKVDLDVFFGDAAAFQKYGKQAVPQPAPAPVIPPAPAPPPAPIPDPVPPPAPVTPPAPPVVPDPVVPPVADPTPAPVVPVPDPVVTTPPVVPVNPAPVAHPSLWQIIIEFIISLWRK